MSWLYSQALVEAFSAGTCSAGAPSAPLSEMPTPQAYWWHDKTTALLRLSRYGMTCARLTDDRGEALLTWFREAFPVKTFPSPGMAQASTASEAGFGAKWHASLARFDRDSSSWKIPQLSLFEGSAQSSVTWPRWGTMRDGESWALATPELRITERGFGSWPTPVANDAKNATLPPAALTRDSIPGRLLRRYGHQIRQKGALNPMWIEWRMGWPIGWTDFAPLATDKFRQWQRWHGGSSAEANDET